MRHQRGRDSSDRHPTDILGLPKSFRLDLRNARGLQAVLNFLSLSRTKPLIDQVFSLKDVIRAQQRLAEENYLGEIIPAWIRNPYASHSKRKIRLTVKR